VLLIPRKFTMGVKIDMIKVTSEKNIREGFQFSFLILSKILWDPLAYELTYSICSPNKCFRFSRFYTSIRLVRVGSKLCKKYILWRKKPRIVRD